MQIVMSMTFAYEYYIYMLYKRPLNQQGGQKMYGINLFFMEIPNEFNGILVLGLNERIHRALRAVLSSEWTVEFR